MRGHKAGTRPPVSIRRRLTRRNRKDQDLPAGRDGPAWQLKENQMTGNADAGLRILGSLGTAEGKGVVQMRDRLDAGVGEVWSALTDPSRLASWWGIVEGDLRQGGEYRAHVHASGWEGTGRIEACEPGRRLLLAGAEADRDVQFTEVTLAADGPQTILVWEEHGMPVTYLAAYGAGIQVHVEDLAAYLAGRGRCDSDARMGELESAYADLAARVR
jgi:uncharacterized protein YndB with AHSA1/START domain